MCPGHQAITCNVLCLCLCIRLGLIDDMKGPWYLVAFLSSVKPILLVVLVPNTSKHYAIILVVVKSAIFLF